MLHQPIVGLNLLLLLISCNYPAMGQDAVVDSLKHHLETLEEDTNKVNALNDLAFHLHSSSPRQTIILSDQSIELSKKLRYQKGLAKANNQKGIGYWYVGEYDSSITLFEKAYLLYGEVDNKVGQSAVLNNVGNLYRIQGNYPKAIENYQKSLKIDEQLGDQNGVGISMVNIGLIYKNQEDWEKSLQYYQDALKIFRQNSNDFGVGVVLNNLGEVYIGQKEFDKALEVYQDAIVTMEGINADCRVVFSQLGIGDVYRLTANSDSSLVYYKKSLQAGKECENPFIVTQSLLGLGEIMKQEKEYSQASEYLLEAYHLSEEKKLLKQKGLAAAGLAFIYERQKNFDQALAYYKVFHESNDSLLNSDKIKEIARLEYDYAIDKERTRNTLEQEKKDLLYESKLERGRKIRQVYIVVTSVVLIIALGYYNEYKKKKRSTLLLEQKNKLITQQNDKIVKNSQELMVAHDKLKELTNFREGLTHMIAHDMKNSLNIIIGLSEQETGSKRMNLIGQSGRLIHNLVMNMLQAQKMEEAGIQLNLEHCPISEIFKESVRQVQLFLRMSAIEVDLNAGYDPLVYIDKELFTRVMVNLLTNAIKYSPVAGVVSIISYKSSNDGFFRIDVKDQGDGIPEDQLPHIFDKYWNESGKSTGKSASTGLGLTFCKLAIEAHNGKIAANSPPGEGATITLEIPISTPGHDEILQEASGIKPTANHSGLEGGSKKMNAAKAELRELQVHEIGLIYKVVSSLPDSKWKEELKASVILGDEKRYQELIET